MQNLNVDQYEKEILEAFGKLSKNEQELVKQRANGEKADTVVTWILWLFLGMWGAHRFYLKRNNAILMLVLTIIGYLTAILLVGFLILLITWVWWIVDAFHINQFLKQNRFDALYDSILFITNQTVDSINQGKNHNVDVDNDDITDFSHPQK